MLALALFILLMYKRFLADVLSPARADGPARGAVVG
jgi:hypothetical protein